MNTTRYRDIWKIRISDGWAEYEYTLSAANYKACIDDVKQAVCKFLKAEASEGKLVRFPSKQIKTKRCNVAQKNRLTANLS